MMGLIFVLSAQPNLGTDLGLIDLIGRKIAHAGVFGSLCLLWLWALGPVTGRALAGAVLISVVYAVTDEYHQTHIEGRSGNPVDVGIDAAGIAIAAWMAASGALARALGALRRRWPPRRDPD